MTQLPKVSHPSPGIQIVDNIAAQPAVETFEGRVGLLLQGDATRAHFFEIPAHAFTAEHPHPVETIIYTVSGQWVLCSDNVRTLMPAGSIYLYSANIPTGYEVPFEEPATILIFSSGTPSPATEFLDYLENEMRPELEAEHAQGHPCFLEELAADHPARVFARQVNPNGGW